MKKIVLKFFPKFYIYASRYKSLIIRKINGGGYCGFQQITLIDIEKRF